MGKSRRKKSNDVIRAHAGSLRKVAFSFDEEIIAAVEEALGWTLSEEEQRIAVKEYNRARSEVLA